MEETHAKIVKKTELEKRHEYFEQAIFGFFKISCILSRNKTQNSRFGTFFLIGLSV